MFLKNVVTSQQTDRKLPGSAITHLSSLDNGLLDGIEILPSKAPMICIAGHADADTQHAANKPRHVKRETLSTLARTQHNERISRDLSYMALSVASTIETAEQWKEFCQDVGGLKPILQCIHNVAEEIKHGRATEVESDHLLSNIEENRFSTACSACRILRDLCGKDSNWASAITDDIIRLNKDGTIIADLVMLLRHANEAERIYSREVWRKRRKLRALGILSINLKTRKQRRGKKMNDCASASNML